MAQFKARQRIKREEDEGKATKALREQLDQCLKRLEKAEEEAAARVRHAEEEALALRSALSAAESRLAEMEALEADVVSRGHQINECQEGAMALKNALSNANFRLAGMDALGADMKARTEELEECQQKRRSSEEDLVKERGRTQHLVGALRDMEIGSAVLSSREGAAIARSESLEQELHHQDAKVSELSRLCEELQKRVVCLQSGEEVERTRRQGAEAFGLAERQDQLLEDASARLELLKEESRHLRKELGRAEEISQTARNILEPVLLNARSCLGVAEGVSGAAVEQPHRRGTENRGQFKRAAMKPSELGNGGDDGDLREASLEGLAREAAEVLSLALDRARSCTVDATSYRWAASASGNEFLSAGDERPLRDSNVAAAFEGMGADQLLPRHAGDEITGCGTLEHGASGGGGNLAETYSSSISRPTICVAPRDTGQRGVVTWGRVDGRERSGDMVQRGPRSGSPLRGGGPGGRTGRGGGDGGGGAAGDAGQYRGRRRGGGGGDGDERGGEDGWQAGPSRGGGGSRERSGKGSHCSRVRGPRNSKCSTKDGGCGEGWGGAEIAIPDCASIRRMEAVRRGEEGGAFLIGGVKSRRRSYMQGERPGSTVDGKKSTRSGSRSPGTAMIRQRIRDAQTTLRTLRSTTD